jgi:hypothetical protein
MQVNKRQIELTGGDMPRVYLLSMKFARAACRRSTVFV